MSTRFQKLEFRSEEPEIEGHNHAAPVQKVAPGLAIRTAADILAEAVGADRLEEWEGALRLYTRALGEDRTLRQAWVGQVRMLVELGEFPEACLWSDKALEIFRGDGDLLAARSLALLRDEDTTGAAAGSDSATTAPGTSSFRWLARGEVLLACRKARSVDCFERAVREAETQWSAASEVARICCMYDHAATAADFAQRAVSMCPTHPVPWLALGRAELAMGMRNKAHTSIQRSLELDRNFRAAKAVLIEAETHSAFKALARRVGSALKRPKP